MRGGGGYLFQTHFGGGGGGLIETGPGEREGLIQFTKGGGISSPKSTRTQTGKGQVKEVGGHGAQVQTSSW